jgi:2-amino-4-hydroxy-6-hydroxymethyldihydropteridine diphosphokinase
VSEHSAVLLIGSNIEPTENIRKVLIELCHFGIIRQISRVWQTPSYGSHGPDFINLAIELLTVLPLEEVKMNAIPSIELKLGRKRSLDRNAPRTIDLDIILYDGMLLDQTIWTRVHAAVPIAELFPELVSPDHKTTLASTAEFLSRQNPLREREDILRTTINK